MTNIKPIKLITLHPNWAARVLAPAAWLLALAASSIAQEETKRSPDSLHEKVVVDANFPGAYQVEVADVNGDKKPDVIAVGGSTCAWYENPTWKKRIVTGPESSPGIISSATADLDQDGKAEIAIAYEFEMNEPKRGKLLLAIQDDASGDHWRVEKIQDFSSIHRLRWGDFNGDGKLDLVAAPILAPRPNRRCSRKAALRSRFLTSAQNPRRGNGRLTRLDSNCLYCTQSKRSISTATARPTSSQPVTTESSGPSPSAPRSTRWHGRGPNSFEAPLEPRPKKEPAKFRLASSPTVEDFWPRSSPGMEAKSPFGLKPSLDLTNLNPEPSSTEPSPTATRSGLQTSTTTESTRSSRDIAAKITASRFSNIRMAHGIGPYSTRKPPLRISGAASFTRETPRI